MSYTIIAQGAVAGLQIAIREWPTPDREGQTQQLVVDGVCYSMDAERVPIYAVNASMNDRMAGKYANIMSASEIRAELK